MTDVRKISMSLWVNEERGAAEIRRVLWQCRRIAFRALVR